MRPELFPTGRDPLRRLGTTTLLAGLLGLAAVVYSMVNFVRGRAGGEEWMFVGVGGCLLVVAVLASLVQGVLVSYGARLEALEKGASADASRPVDGTPSRTGPSNQV